MEGAGKEELLMSIFVCRLAGMVLRVYMYSRGTRRGVEMTTTTTQVSPAPFRTAFRRSFSEHDRFKNQIYFAAILKEERSNYNQCRPLEGKKFEKRTNPQKNLFPRETSSFSFFNSSSRSYNSSNIFFRIPYPVKSP